MIAFIMELLLVRTEKLKALTFGELFINGVFFCYTLEDTDRNLKSEQDIKIIEKIKIKHSTAIPTGKFKVIISYSNRFKQLLPLLLNVKGFLGIRIHSGNIAEHSSGCVLVGSIKYKNSIGNSRVTMKKLLTKLNRINKSETITISIGYKI